MYKYKDLDYLKMNDLIYRSKADYIDTQKKEKNIKDRLIVN